MEDGEANRRLVLLRVAKGSMDTDEDILLTNSSTREDSGTDILDYPEKDWSGERWEEVGTDIQRKDTPRVRPEV